MGEVMQGTERRAERPDSQLVDEIRIVDRIRESEPEPERICLNCKWRGEDASHDAEPVVSGPTCRRHAPVATGGMMSGSRTMWPIVQRDDWCGDFEHAIHDTKPQTLRVIADKIDPALPEN